MIQVVVLFSTQCKFKFFCSVVGAEKGALGSKRCRIVPFASLVCQAADNYKIGLLR